MQAEPGTNFHIYWLGSDFVTDVPEFASLGEDAMFAASTTTFEVSEQIATFTGEDVSTVFDWFMGLNVWASDDTFGLSGRVPERLEALKQFPTNGPPP